MDQHRSNPFRRGPKAESSEGGRQGRGRARPEAERPAKRAGLRQLPSDLNDLAEGRIDRLRRPRRAPEVLVEPEGSTHVIPGVRNSEARTVYDARVARLRSAAGREDAAALADGMYEVQRLALWRARNVTDFDAFAEHVVGLSVERARELAAQGAAAAGATEDGATEVRPWSREFVALWVRSEAALIQICPTASVRVVTRNGRHELELRVPAEPVPTAIEALKSLGPALGGLAKLTAADVPERTPRPRR
jgi:hypothetical protein